MEMEAVTVKAATESQISSETDSLKLSVENSKQEGEFPTCSNEKCLEGHNTLWGKLFEQQCSNGDCE